MKKISKKSIIALVAALTTMLSIAVVTFAGDYVRNPYNAGSTSGYIEVGFNGCVGYAEVKADSNVYASVDGYAFCMKDGIYIKSIIYGSFDDDTYGQFSATCVNQAHGVYASFVIVSEDGRFSGTIRKTDLVNWPSYIN